MMDGTKTNIEAEAEAAADIISNVISCYLSAPKVVGVEIPAHSELCYFCNKKFLCRLCKPLWRYGI